MTFSLADRNKHERQSRLIKEQDERYARGEPINGELAARMTKPKAADKLFQVFVDIRGETGSHPVSPRFAGSAGEEACGQILEVVNAQICLGKLKGWGNARIEPITLTPNH